MHYRSFYKTVFNYSLLSSKWAGMMIMNGKGSEGVSQILYYHSTCLVRPRETTNSLNHIYTTANSTVKCMVLSAWMCKPVMLSMDNMQQLCTDDTVTSK
jgi:hypothetical protein